MDVVRAAELRAQGVSPQAIDRLSRSGRVTRVRHGAYADVLGADDGVRHRQVIAGTWPLLGEGAVLSHASAGLLHGLPLWDGMLQRVSFVRAAGGHARIASHIRVRLEPLMASEVVEIDGYRVTSLERTAFDIARTVEYEKAVAVLDAALRAHADRSELAVAAEQARGRKGVGVARAALTFADERSESVGESISRARLVAAGLPLPELQINVFDEGGNWVARSDFGWLSRGVLGEFDGRIKYLGTADEVGTAVMNEKRREARLRDLGWTVTRWGMADLALETLRHRLEVAFAQAEHAAIRGWAQPTVRH
jgi:predicted transcriptional regulator of viral defense system